jgi:hypothetical protein
MSPEDRAVLNRGLRFAFVATAGLTVEGLRGDHLPFLSPLIALTVVAAIPGPPPMKLVAVLGGVAAAATTAAWLVSAVALSIPGVYALGVGLIYLWCFAMVFTPKLALIGDLALTMSIVVSSLSAASTGLAAGLALQIVLSLLIAFGLVFLAHAIFPQPPLPTVAQPTAFPHGGFSTKCRAALAVAVLLPLHLAITAKGVPSIILLMTTATMLRQPGLAQSLNWSVVAIIGNALGGIAATAAATVTGLHDAPALAVALVALLTLSLATQTAKGPQHAAIFTSGMVTFVLLYGMSLSPVIAGDGVGATQRVLRVAVAAAYAVGA